MTYSKEHIRAAAERTLEFFEQHPYSRLTTQLATNDTYELVDVHSPEATCFCFVGRFARELGPLPSYELGEPGYEEVNEAIGTGRCNRLWETNDQFVPLTTPPELLKLERQLLAEFGVL